MIKSIIVEDDPTHSSRLEYFIKRLNVPIEVLTTSNSVESALNAIQMYNPDLVFLDIELEGGQNGFDLLTQSDRIFFDVIFTTAHIDKNIQEIRTCGVDYIVKPYVFEEISEVLGKYITGTSSSNNLMKEKLNLLRENILVASVDQRKIWVSDNNTEMQLSIIQILYCKSDNQYTRFYFFEDNSRVKTIISSRGLGEWERDLEGYKFCRIHRRYLVNIMYIKKFIKTEDIVVLSTGTQLDISRSGKERLKSVMKTKT